MFCKKCGTKIIDGNNFCTECGTPVRPVAATDRGSIKRKNASNDDFPDLDMAPLLAFFRQYRWFFIAPVAFIIVAYTVYYVAFKPNPIKLADEAGKATCDCLNKSDENTVAALSDFDKSFDKTAYKKRSDAYDAMREKTEPENAKLADCLKAAEIHGAELRGKFIDRHQDLSTFDNQLATYSNNCVRPLQADITKLGIGLDKKIREIKNAQPDEAKLKADLTGRNLQGWTFQSPADIKSLAMHDAVSDAGSFECQAEVDVSNGREARSFSNVRMRYAMNDAGDWYLTTLECKDFSITYTVGNQYQQISLPAGVHYSIDTRGRRGWVKDDSWGSSNQMIGPDAVNSYSLNTSTIYLASREANQDIPITLNFHQN